MNGEAQGRRQGLPVRISFLVAVRNKVRTIARCLQSLCVDAADEVIVVNGNSSDGTSQVVDSFPVNHLYDEGKGPSAARNIGLRKCSGEFVVIIDGDQWVSQGFSRRLKLIIDGNKCDVIFPREMSSGHSVWATAIEMEKEVVIELMTLRGSLMPRIYKRALLQKVGGWDEDFSAFEDLDLWNRSRRLAKSRVHTSDLVIYHDASDVTMLSEFRRMKWYGSSLARYVKRYPKDWRWLLSWADFLLVARIFAKTREFRLALYVLLIRSARSLGWLVGLALSIFCS